MDRNLRTIWASYFIICSIVASSPARPETNWLADRKEAMALYHKGSWFAGDSCSKIWNLVWPWAKKGNSDALSFLAGTMHWAGLVPKGANGDRQSQIRHLASMTVYGAPHWNGHKKERMFFGALLKAPSIAQVGGHRFMKCLDKGTLPRSCVDEAVRTRFVPRFADYVRELDALAGGGSPARCIPGYSYGLKFGHRPSPER
jgi:hypothetical protein